MTRYPVYRAGMTQADLGRTFPSPWAPKVAPYEWVCILIRHDREHAQGLSSGRQFGWSMSVSVEQLEELILRMPPAFTILDFARVFQEQFPALWQQLVERYGLYGSGTCYSALSYLSNRLSACSRRKIPGLLEPTPVGWKPAEGRYLRRSTREERQRFGSAWIVIYRRKEIDVEEGRP